MIKDYKVYLIFLLFFGIFFYSQQYAPVEIKSKTDYVHEKTKVVFPKILNGFTRDKIISYDQRNYNIGSLYRLKADKKTTTISVYIYPAEVSNENLRDQFLSFQEAIRRNSTNQPTLTPEFIKLTSESTIVNGLKSVFDYNLMIPDFMKGQKEQVNKSLFSVYDCGKWNIKFRITSESYDKERLLEVEKILANTFNPLKIGEENSLEAGKNAKIVISKTAQRDSLMLKSTITEAEAKKEWLSKNKTTSELKTGFSDFEIESYEFAINEKLKYYRENKDKLAENVETKNYFENLQKISDNNFLRDFIYNQTFGVIIYPEGEGRKQLFADFMEKNNIPSNIIELMYRIYY